jgi:hypothetical protein
VILNFIERLTDAVITPSSGRPELLYGSQTLLKKRTLLAEHKVTRLAKTGVLPVLDPPPRIGIMEAQVGATAAARITANIVRSYIPMMALSTQ